MEDRQQSEAAASGEPPVGGIVSLQHLPMRWRRAGPDSLHCITAIAMILQNWERRLSDILCRSAVIAILVGIASAVFGSLRNLERRHFIQRKTLLEIAVVLLGASISLGAIVASGPALLSGIVVTVVAALAASYATSRTLACRAACPS